MALNLVWVAFSALSCSRALDPPAPMRATLGLERLSRCASSGGQVETGVVGSGSEVEGAPPQALLSRAAREAHLQRGPLLEAWRPLLTALKRPLQPDTTAWLPAHVRDLNLEELWLNADVLVSLGAPLDETLRPLLRVDLSSLRALSWLKAAPELSPLASLTLDPEAEVKAWRASNWSPLQRGSVGLILEEQRLLYIQDTGEGVRLVQEAVRVNNKRGAEELGEVALPVNASLLSLYTLKPNGARRAPIVIPEKDSYSLQDVQPGDVMIARYLEPLAPLRRAGGVLTPRLPIHDAQRAVWRRVYHVWRLGERPLELYWHHAQPAPKGDDSPQLEVKERAIEGGKVVSVSISRALPRALEPAGLSVSEAPHLQVSEPMSAEREWGEVLAQLRTVTYFAPGELEALRAWAGGERQLGARVWRQLEEERPLLESSSALKSVQARQGSRALLLWASLSALGSRCALWIARPPEVGAVSQERVPSTTERLAQVQQRSQEVDPSLSLAHFEHILVACEADGGGAPVLYDPALYLSPRGVISTALMGGEARVLWPPPRGARCALLEGPRPEAWPLPSVPLSWPEVPQEKHELDVSLWLDPEGGRGLLGARVTFGHAEHMLSGEEGALLYERLSRASDQERVGWLERQWGAWLGAAAVSGLRFAWSESEGLALAYDLKLTLRLPARVSISPQRWGERFASLENRRETLVLPPITQQVRLSLLPHPPEREGEGGGVAPGSGWALTFQGEERALQWPLEGAMGEESGGAVTFQRTLHKEQATMVWRSRGGLISKARYSSWASFARAVSAQERALRLGLIER